MNDEAPVPTQDPTEKERNGLTVLDLTKHAALTTLESLDDNDCLGIVTFSDEGKIIQTLLPMTARNKGAARRHIEGLRPGGNTNLWHGILKGMDLFKNLQNLKGVPAIMVLTDGVPNQW
jgi:Mg-chelatase subunit ChlD